jgi:hypothetical protein
MSNTKKNLPPCGIDRGDIMVLNGWCVPMTIVLDAQCRKPKSVMALLALVPNMSMTVRAKDGDWVSDEWKKYRIVRLAKKPTRDTHLIPHFIITGRNHTCYYMLEEEHGDGIGFRVNDERLELLLDDLADGKLYWKFTYNDLNYPVEDALPHRLPSYFGGVMSFSSVKKVKK